MRDRQNLQSRGLWSNRCNKAGKLSEAQLCDFARTGKFDETVVTISLICDMPVGVIERAIVNDSTDQLLVLVKSAGLSWETAKTVLLMSSKAKSRSKTGSRTLP